MRTITRALAAHDAEDRPVPLTSTGFGELDAISVDCCPAGRGASQAYMDATASLWPQFAHVADTVPPTSSMSPPA